MDGVIFKSGTSLWGVHPMIRQAIWVSRDALRKVAGRRCVVTSCWDATHGKGSFHHYGMAVDIRSKEIPTAALKREVRDVIATTLGPGYDVILEHLGGPNEHFHIEWEAGRPIRESWIKYVFMGTPAPDHLEPDWDRD